MEERWLSKRKKRSDSLKILMDDTLTLKEGSLNSIDEVKEMFPSCLKECELVRYVLSGDNLRLFVVYDIEEEHHHDHEEEEEDGCCANLNGHLFSVLFHGVKDVVIKGEECDNYTLLSSEIDENRISLSYEGNNHAVVILIAVCSCDCCGNNCVARKCGCVCYLAIRINGNVFVG